MQEDPLALGSLGVHSSSSAMSTMAGSSVAKSEKKEKTKKSKSKGSKSNGAKKVTSIEPKTFSPTKPKEKVVGSLEASFAKKCKVKSERK